jgi:hypothetical protein
MNLPLRVGTRLKQRRYYYQCVDFMKLNTDMIVMGVKSLLL